MKYFEDEKQAINYTVNELIATLEDDINDQKRNNEPPEDYEELEDKIDDISEVQNLIAAAPELLEACKMVQDISVEPREAFKAMQSAINKAEGKT